jgi:hypothetical protein
VVGCSRVGSRAASVRTSRTVRVVGADCPRGALSPSCSSCSSRVLERLCFDPVGQQFLVGRCLADSPPGRRGLSARHELLADCQRGTSSSRTVQGRGTDRPRDEVPVGSFCSCLTESLPWVSDRPPQGRGLSARAAAVS